MRGLRQEIVSGFREVPWLTRRYRPPLFSWENYRLLFDAAFWLMLGVTYVGYMVLLVGPLGVTLAFCAVVLLWHLLPWDLATAAPAKSTTSTYRGVRARSQMIQSRPPAAPPVCATDMLSGVPAMEANVRSYAPATSTAMTWQARA
jgi:hypothetical protein